MIDEKTRSSARTVIAMLLSSFCDDLSTGNYVTIRVFFLCKGAVCYNNIYSQVSSIQTQATNPNVLEHYHNTIFRDMF